MTITATRRSSRPWFTALGAATTLAIMLAGCSSPEVDSAEAAADETATDVRTTGNQYGTKAPYAPFEDLDDYAPVPDGYELCLWSTSAVTALDFFQARSMTTFFTSSGRSRMSLMA